MQHAAIPDFVPVSFADEYGVAAAQQVAASRRRRVRPGRAKSPGTGRVPRTSRLRSSTDLPMATVAVLLALLGTTGLTVLWGHLAASQDPMWWTFASVGAGVAVVLMLVLSVLAVVTVRSRSRNRRSPAAS